MIETACYIYHFLIMQSRYFLWLFLVLGVPMAKLTVISSPVSVNMTIVTESYRMIASTSYLQDIYSLSYILSDLCRSSIAWIWQRDCGRVFNPLSDSRLILIAHYLRTGTNLIYWIDNRDGKEFSNRLR